MPYVYYFWQIFQALRLFPALRLFRILEQVKPDFTYKWLLLIIIPWISRSFFECLKLTLAIMNELHIQCRNRKVWTLKSLTMAIASVGRGLDLWLEDCRFRFCTKILFPSLCNFWGLNFITKVEIIIALNLL